MMLESLKEMKTGSEPDDSADYWDERTKIDTWTADCKKRFVEEADMDSRKADWH